MVLPDGLTWETVTTKNAGVDLEMLAGRLQFTGDVFSRLTTDMYTIGMTLPATFGATSPRGNYADMKTKGWEASLSWQDRFQIASRFLLELAAPDCCRLANMSPYLLSENVTPAASCNRFLITVSDGFSGAL